MPQAFLQGLPAGLQATAPGILQQGGAIMYTMGVPQAPATFVVDTSEPAMAMDGLQQQYTPAPRARSVPRRATSPSSRQESNSQPNNSNMRVTIIKQGAP
jgi:hypothetical protein